MIGSIVKKMFCREGEGTMPLEIVRNDITKMKVDARVEKL